MSTDIPQDRAVLDRIVDGRIAVLLIGSAGDPLHLPAAHLPAGVQEGDWLVLDLAALVTGVDRELTERRRGDLETRMQRLRTERSGGRFARRELEPPPEDPGLR